MTNTTTTTVCWVFQYTTYGEWPNEVNLEFARYNDIVDYINKHHAQIKTIDSLQRKDVIFVDYEATRKYLQENYLIPCQCVAGLV